MVASASVRELGSFPIARTRLIGRDAEREAARTFLLDAAVPLLTLTGPGGVGKTRLALAIAGDVADHFADGVVWVDLAPLADAALVPAAVAAALGVVAPDRSLTDGLMAHLRSGRRLLVLDNCEHVLAGTVNLVATVLSGCPTLQVLATSRATLHVSGEREYPVPPLALPSTGDMPPNAMADVPAVRLYVERAWAVDPSFRLTEGNAPAVAAICTRLDGLPLAIELAAARSKVLPPALLLPRLARQLPLLTGGPRDVPARLQTMREAIVWSYDLLNAEEQLLLARLAVFAGGFTLEAAEVVCRDLQVTDRAPMPPSTLDGIASLVDKSLLLWRDAAGSRLGMLETIREFALEQLAAAGDANRARAAHAAYFATLDAWLEPNHVAPGERVDDRLWAIEAELANVRAALGFLANAGEAEGVLRLAGSFAIFWHHRGNLTEGRQWLEWALEHAPESATACRARALAGFSLLLWSQGHLALAGPPADAARRIAEAINHTELTALSVHLLGLVALAERQWAQATSHMTEALALWRSLGLPSDEAMALRALAWVAYETGDAASCIQRGEESLALFRAVGHPSGAAGALGLLAQLAHDQGDDATALGAYHEALHLWSRADTRWAATRGPGGSSTAFTFPGWAGIDDRRLLVQALTGLAAVAAEHAQRDQAAMLLGAADRRWDDAVMAAKLSACLKRNETTTAVRAALGAAPFAALHGAGHQLGFGDAVALALTISVPGPLSGTSTRQLPAHGAATLTDRQVEVLRLLIAGRSDREIAAALFLSPRTVQDHVSRLLAKLGVANRTEAVAVAVRDQLV